MKLRISKAAINDLPVDVGIILESWTLGESPRLKEMVEVMAHFAVTDEGQPMPYAEARRIIGAQPMGKLGDLTTEFGEALRETAVPPVNSGPSS
jgi:hypothetical protein